MNRARKKADNDQKVFELQADLCKAFAHPTRLRLLDMLGRKTWSASDLQKELSISKANLSQHLAILRTAGAIETRREGRRMLCRLAIPEVKQACHLIRGVLKAQFRNDRGLRL